MLINFSFRNFRTFRERADWNLVASPDKTREADNVADLPAFGLRLLKSAVVYGANASGKSKLVDGLKYMRWMVLSFSKSGQAGESTQIEPFALNPTSAQASSEFEIQFVYQKELYRYGFEVSSTKVEAEWFFVRTEKAVRVKPEIELFYRTGQEIAHHPRQFGGIIGELIKNDAVRENALLLSVAAQFNQPRAAAALKWFFNLKFLSGLSDEGYRGFMLNQLGKPVQKQAILSFLDSANLDIEDVEEGEQPAVSIASFSEKLSDEAMEQLQKRAVQRNTDVKIRRRAYSNDRAPADSVDLSLIRQESAGTQKLLTLAGPVLDVLARGFVMVADELDSRLHPNLVCKIVHLFNSNTTNPHNAQLLFNTHDTNLLTSGNFRRDQIWFTEKNRYGEASLYSLADFKTDQVRKDDNFEANYVRGKYGAVPYLGDFGALPAAAPAAPNVAADAE